MQWTRRATKPINPNSLALSEIKEFSSFFGNWYSHRGEIFSLNRRPFNNFECSSILGRNASQSCLQKEMAILYAVVARGTVILAEFSAVTGNTGAVARRILEKLPNEADSRLCFSQERYIFHILRSDGLTFLCMANDTFGRRIPFSYLEDIHMRFMKNYGRVAHYAPAYAMNDEFSRVLHQQMEFFSSNPSADTLNRVRGEVNEVRTIMVDNIEKILERGDRIELLVDKTATMQDGAFHFKKQSKRLRRALWMKNAKLLALMTCLIVVFLYAIVAAFCGGITLSSCRS